MSIRKALMVTVGFLAIVAIVAALVLLIPSNANRPQVTPPPVGEDVESCFTILSDEEAPDIQLADDSLTEYAAAWIYSDMQYPHIRELMGLDAWDVIEEVEVVKFYLHPHGFLVADFEYLVGDHDGTTGTDSAAVTLNHNCLIVSVLIPQIPY